MPPDVGGSVVVLGIAVWATADVEVLRVAASSRGRCVVVVSLGVESDVVVDRVIVSGNSTVLSKIQRTFVYELSRRFRPVNEQLPVTWRLTFGQCVSYPYNLTGHLTSKGREVSKQTRSKMNEEDLHLAQAMVEMGLEDQPQTPKKTIVSRVQEKVQGFRRTRSLNAPSPIQQFGPCGRIMKNSAMVMTIQDPASQRLTWYKPPLTVLVIKKVRDVSVLQPFVQLVRWLIEEKNMVVFVEQTVMDDTLLINNSGFSVVKDKLMTFRDGKDDLTDKIDFIICLGGDGTLLYASLLFQQSVPPVMAFHLGSLGFLTPFEFDNFQEQVTNVLEGHAALTLRSRLRCIIMRKNDELNKTSKPPTNLLVLNEVVIDRGPSPYLSNIDLFLDGKHITSVQGDGLIVSTPTGSTAYAVAAGASMIHPSVPAIMVTPICPHSLSFRPIVVPAGVELKISVSPDSRNTSWVSFDGRNRQELFHGDR